MLSDFLQALSRVEFANIGWLHALWLVPVALILQRLLRKRAFQLGSWTLLPDVAPSMRTRLRRLPLFLMSLGCVFVVVSLAGPQEARTLPIRRQGMDILLVVDTSSSMTEKDMAEDSSRLAVAQWAARSFIEERTEDRIGLLRFSRHVDLLCPPTQDHEALLEVLDGLAPTKEDSGEDATAIGAAIAMAADVLSHREQSSQIVVLLTDGEENVATPGAKGEIAPTHAAQYCTALGIRAYTIAVGGGKRLPSGERASLDTTAIERIASMTDGRFFQATDADAARDVYTAIGELEQMEYEEVRVEHASLLSVTLTLALLAVFVCALLRWTVLRVLP